MSNTFVHLDEPVKLTPDDDRTSLLVGHITVGGAPAALFVGAVVRLRKRSGLRRILTITTLTVNVISTNRAAPTQGESGITGVTTQF